VSDGSYAPSITRVPNHITLFDLAVDPPALWDEQRARLGL